MKLLTPDEAAAIIGCPRATVDTLIASDQLQVHPNTPNEQNVRITKEALEDYLTTTGGNAIPQLFQAQTHQSDTPRPNQSCPPRLPSAAPTWITDELLRDTLATWQPYYQTALTADDALDIILTVANLIDVMG